MNDCQVKEKKGIKLSREWLLFLYRLFPLGDGEHTIVIRKENGILVKWRTLEPRDWEQVSR